MQRFVLRSTVATFGLALVLVACGGDDGDDSGATETTAAMTVATDATASTGASATSDVDMPVTGTAGASATSDVDMPVAGTTGSGGGEFCEAAQPLAEFNANTEPLDMTAEFEDMRDQAVSVINDGMGLYDDAIAAAPDEIRSQIETLRDLNESLAETLGDASSMEDFTAVIEDLGTSDVLTATTELNDYLEAECGFGLTMG